MGISGRTIRRALGVAVGVVALVSGVWATATQSASSQEGVCGYAEVHLQAVTSTTIAAPVTQCRPPCPGFHVSHTPVSVSVQNTVFVQEYACVVIED